MPINRPPPLSKTSASIVELDTVPEKDKTNTSGTKTLLNVCKKNRSFDIGTEEIEETKSYDVYSKTTVQPIGRLTDSNCLNF